MALRNIYRMWIEVFYAFTIHKLGLSTNAPNKMKQMINA